MKIIHLFAIISLSIGCSTSKYLKEQQRNQFQATDLTYQETVGNTSLLGIITEADTKESVIYGSVALYKNDVLIKGVETNFDGEYVFNDLEAGVYIMEISYVGFPTKRITGVDVKQGFKMVVNAEMEAGIVFGCGTVCWFWNPPLIEIDNFTKGQILTSEQVQRRRSSN